MVKATQMMSLKQFSLLYLFCSHQGRACSSFQTGQNQCLCAAPRVFQAVLPDTINQTFDLEQDDFLSKVFIYG